MSVPLRTLLGQPSWSFRSSHVAAALTQLGGQLGPVMFRLGARTIAPFSVAPWAEEKAARDLIPLLAALRGDFFCAPFGGNGTAWRGEKHPPHGETANARWKLHGVEKSGARTTLHASLATKIRRGRADKFITLVDGETVIYQRHVLSGSRGPMDVGHHAMVKFPEEPGSGIVSTSRFVHAQVFPGVFESPENRGYSALEAGATFDALDRVPLSTGGTTDLSRYPARRGFEDLVMLTADAKLPFAWNAVTFPRQRYVWFSLRNPRLLRHTILWISNGGRHYAPWNGRHTGVMGIEDTTSYFHYGLAESAKPNPLNRRGMPTALTLDPKNPTTIDYIIGVAAIPAGFDRVKDIRAIDGAILLDAANGKSAQCVVDLGFLNASNE
ncbi:MAG TPA: hypothetical protein VM029_16625 [Opitutaceae bacterium]|nr:hypothetical protein [Opitutaceae bacterium]